MQILTGIAPNAGPPIAQVDTATPDKYVGTYSFNSAVSIAVTRTDNRLFVQMTGQPRLSLKTVSATEFSVEGVPATIRFETAANGDVTLLLDQNGMVQRVKRSSR